MLLLFESIVLTFQQKIFTPFFGESSPENAVLFEHSTLHLKSTQEYTSGSFNYKNSLPSTYDSIRLSPLSNSFLIQSKNAAIISLDSTTLFYNSILNYLEANQKQELLITASYLAHEVDANTQQNWGAT
ncbi:MAG: hypothetical protein JKY08_00465 [Flavobacteriaceae bacterium]|nr:hypothetical protein [Flavobacteriaceae bacterium]